MQAFMFWKTVTMDHSNLLENLIEVLKKNNIQFCVIGGQAVNAYAEPLVSLDLDLAVAVDQIDEVEALLEKHFVVKQFPHSLNVTIPDSDVRVQIQTDKRYSAFVERASPRFVLGMELPVASVEDVLQGKIWAALDAERRGSKRQKDLADIARILENYPQYRSEVPQEILKRLLD
jgi:predicted nucleotidyltransferase